ncbi:MAG: VanW family protein [Oscillospiraceae bacterium]|nr:VanW family protein [Oscillospiraceae bacterium]
MGRKLFCEISPFTYSLSVKKERLKRHARDLFAVGVSFARSKGEKLPAVIYQHNSLMRRKLGNVDMDLQENKAVNLSLAAPKVNGILIKPNETFSFWRLAGECTAAKGYQEGLTISSGKTGRGIGGGMCQFTNLLHWMVLHSPLDVVERHHHNGVDLFPDYGRQVPFGLGTSIMYNYLDYRVKNNTDNTFQFITYTTSTHLCGELRAFHPIEHSYHITEEDKCFTRIGEQYYRRNRVYRSKIDKRTGETIEKALIAESNAKVMYGSEFIQKDLLCTDQN